MDAEEHHRKLVRLCVDAIYEMPPSPALKPHRIAHMENERRETAERVIGIVRKWDRGERF